MRANRTRQLQATDHDVRQLTVNCGAALHHAVALAAAGYDAEVSRQPDPGDPDLLAALRVAGIRVPSDNDLLIA